MRVELVNLPWRADGRLGVRAGSRWPFTTAVPEGEGLSYVPFPFYLAYATSWLKRQGVDAHCLDAVASGLSGAATIEVLCRRDPQLLVVETSTPSFESDMGILKEIRLRLPHCRIVLCGPHASVFPLRILKEQDVVSYVLVGEYEVTLGELVQRLADNRSAAGLRGAACREGGVVRFGGHRPPLDDLDLLPWPERQDLPMERYNDAFCGLPQPNVQMWSSRGCPFRCVFCLWPQVMYRERRHRARSAVDVAAEMEFLVRRRSFRAVYFDDDTFNADQRHVLRVCAEIRKRGINVPWAAMARADRMEDAVLDAMAGSGLYAIKYGIESADERVLRSSGKNMDLRRARSAIARTRARGVKVHLTFCVGLPGETKASLAKTRDFLLETRPDSVQFSLATPFPGTAHDRDVRRRGHLVSAAWEGLDGNRACAVRTKDLTADEIEAAWAGLKRDFHAP